MKAIKSLGLCLALAAFLGMTVTAADTPDAWLTTKAKIALLTSEGLSARGVNVDTVNGAVTLHGKVRNAGEKEKAASVVRDIVGVKSVNNLLQVVPEAAKAGVNVADDILKDRAFAALRSDKSVEGITVASVNNGVVLLAGKAPGLTEKLRAIELVSNIDGVARVASEIETKSN